ncbi:MAG: type I secretion protein, partial [Roseovarius sp.]|nr:type I secretion protein [Roseovarius sp.]
MSGETNNPTDRGDGIVEGDSTDNRIDLAYTGDPEGDRIDNEDALLPGEGPQDDIVDAGAGDDTILAEQGDDDVYAGSGDDSVTGGAGDDLIYGDSNLPGGIHDGGDGGTERESFEWDEIDSLDDGIAPGDTVTQNTGNVNV